MCRAVCSCAHRDIHPHAQACNHLWSALAHMYTWAHPFRQQTFLHHAACAISPALPVRAVVLSLHLLSIADVAQSMPQAALLSCFCTLCASHTAKGYVSGRSGYCFAFSKCAPGSSGSTALVLSMCITMSNCSGRYLHSAAHVSNLKLNKASMHAEIWLRYQRSGSQEIQTPQPPQIACPGPGAAFCQGSGTR